MSMQSLSHKSMDRLSRLLLLPHIDGASSASAFAVLEGELLSLSKEEFDDLLALANTNHVAVRALEVFRNIALEARDGARAEWTEIALMSERARIDTALSILQAICNAFNEHRHAVAVIKSLDHWPDLGSDLDLFTNAKPEDVIHLMTSRFEAKIAARSWGDRLARKWNFSIPGLPELIEIHVGRLGQTGEQITIASSLVERTRSIQVGDKSFRVPSVSDRLMISTMQRMYRHFYFRLCDILDSASLMESGSVDYRELRSLAADAGIWEGVATYLAIVSDYVKSYRGVSLDLPQWVAAAARFGGKEIYFARDFLRVPIMPQSAMLYGSQLAGVLRKRQLYCGARLSLLPWLATAALVGQKITGSDKGIW